MKPLIMRTFSVTVFCSFFISTIQKVIRQTIFRNLHHDLFSHSEH
jgi:hypothetical protein